MRVPDWLKVMLPLALVVVLAVVLVRLSAAQEPFTAEAPPKTSSTSVFAREGRANDQQRAQKYEEAAKQTKDPDMEGGAASLRASASQARAAQQPQPLLGGGSGGDGGGGGGGVVDALNRINTTLTGYGSSLSSIAEGVKSAAEASKSLNDAMGDKEDSEMAKDREIDQSLTIPGWGGGGGGGAPE